MSWRRIQDVFKMSWRSFEDALKMLWKRFSNTLWRRLEKVLRTSWRHLKNVLKTSWRRMTKANILVLTNTSRRRVEDVLWRHKSKANIFVLIKTFSSRRMLAGIILIQRIKKSLMKLTAVSAKLLEIVKWLSRILFSIDITDLCILPSFCILVERRLESIKKVFMSKVVLANLQSLSS